MIRVRVEIVPYGVEAEAETLHEIFVANNGTGIPGGQNEGGRGNYDVWIDQDPRGPIDYPENLPGHVGEIKGVKRTPEHRLTVARAALALSETAMGQDPGVTEVISDPRFDLGERRADH